jgi:hypothetical protein
MATGIQAMAQDVFTGMASLFWEKMRITLNVCISFSGTKSLYLFRIKVGLILELQQMLVMKPSLL